MGFGTFKQKPHCHLNVQIFFLLLQLSSKRETPDASGQQEIS
jgi:hypothetical protein